MEPLVTQRQKQEPAWRHWRGSAKNMSCTREIDQQAYALDQYGPNQDFDSIPKGFCKFQDRKSLPKALARAKQEINQTYFEPVLEEEAWEEGVTANNLDQNPARGQLEPL